LALVGGSVGALLAVLNLFAAHHPVVQQSDVSQGICS